MAQINARLENLHQLAQQLDPMEMAYSEVRFLDVDFEQLEKEYDDLIREMGNEIEEEKALDSQIAQFCCQVDDLQANLVKAEDEGSIASLQELLTKTINDLLSKLEEFNQQHAQAKQTRRHVARSEMPSLEQLGNAIGNADAKVKEILKSIEQKQTDAIVEKIQSVLAMASEEIPPEAQILECSEHLQQVPLEDSRSEELCQKVEELKWKKKRQKAIQEGIDKKLAEIGKKLDELAESVPATEEAKVRKNKKGKKKKKQKETAQPEKTREEQILELNKAVELLETNILPELDSLHQEELQENIPSKPSKDEAEQREAALELLHSLKVSLIYIFYTNS